MLPATTRAQRFARRVVAAGRSVESQGLFRAIWPPAVRLGGAFLQLAVTALIARYLGPAEAGAYFFWTAAMMEVGQSATFGLDRLALQKVPRLGREDDSVSRFVAPLRTTALFLSVPGAGALCLYALVFQGDLSRSPLWWSLPFLSVAGVALSMVNSEVLTALGRPALAVFFRNTLGVAVLLAVVLFAGRNLTAEFALGAYALSFCASGFGALPPIRREVGGKAFALPGRARFLGDLRESCPIFFASFFAGMAFLVPLAILDQAAPPEQIAYATTAFRIFVLVDVLAKAVHSLQMPELSRAALNEPSREIWGIYRTSILRGAALLVLPLLLLFVFAEFAMGIFGDDFVPGAPLLRILVALSFVSLLLGPANQLLLMVGHTGRMALVALGHLVAAGGLATILVPRFGGVGLVWVLGTGILLEKVALLVLARRAIAKAAPHREPPPREGDG